MAELSDQEMLRYNRQIILRGFDFEGQEALKDARVLVVGLGRTWLRGNAVSGRRWRRATDATRF
ncbi:molybdopterin biosynthesis MoeB protein [Salmonella enterica subsp. arizonae]|uniref:Molybdopterin biosynthesis MoeB protein n=1 Tax=Salmonella enterica subsp. arizonae TaxID=59203 RepID=A0A379S5S4_SALER|nr:molybdopterin biosynthesis MoeB protein [Salmonella enterica subsp. arizonae]